MKHFITVPTPEKYVIKILWFQSLPLRTRQLWEPLSSFSNLMNWQHSVKVQFIYEDFFPELCFVHIFTVRVQIVAQVNRVYHRMNDLKLRRINSCPQPHAWCFPKRNTGAPPILFNEFRMNAVFYAINGTIHWGIILNQTNEWILQLQ